MITLFTFIRKIVDLCSEYVWIFMYIDSSKIFIRIFEYQFYYSNSQVFQPIFEHLSPDYK